MSFSCVFVSICSSVVILLYLRLLPVHSPGSSRTHSLCCSSSLLPTKRRRVCTSAAVNSFFCVGIRDSSLWWSPWREGFGIGKFFFLLSSLSFLHVCTRHPCSLVLRSVLDYMLLRSTPSTCATALLPFFLFVASLCHYALQPQRASVPTDACSVRRRQPKCWHAITYGSFLSAFGKEVFGSMTCFVFSLSSPGACRFSFRSQIRTLLHFPLFRHIVNVNCATAFSYPFLSSPSPPPPPLASSPSSTNPSTHHTAYASAGPHGSSLPKDASSSSSLPALSQGSGQSAFAEQHQQRQVWRDRREEEEGDLVCNEASSSSSGSSGSGDRKRNSSSTSPLVLRPDELPDKTAGGRGREGEVGQRDGGEEEEGCGSGERMGEDFVFPKTNRAERQEASIGLSDQGKDRTPFNQRTSETEDKEITRKNDLSQDRSVGVSPAEREGRCLYSRERKSRDVHIRSLSGQYPYSSSHPADSAAYQEGERDVPLLAISTGEGGEVFERKNGEQRTQRRERGGEGERRQEEGFRVENDDSHSRPGNVIVVPPSASSSSSFFLPSYPHSHLFTPGVFSSWDGQKRQTSSLFSRWRRSTDPENAEQAFSHGSRSDSKEGSSLTGKDKDEGRGRASRSSGHPGDGQNVADSSAHGSACSLLLPLSLSSPPSKLQVLRCMLADTAAVRSSVFVIDSASSFH